MGVEDTTRTDTRTDTTDKPASSERPYSPPPDNPGSPGQPSRLESLARAREQQQSRSQETQDKDAGSSPREDRDDKATTEQTGSGNEEKEASGKPEAEDQDRREDDDRPGTDQPGQPDEREQEPRSQDEGTTAGEPDTGTPGDRDRDRPQDQAAEPRADTRTEPADRPASSERRWTPPPDNPGSPGQPSRLESLARAREAQQENGSPHTESTDTGTRPTEQRDDQPTTGHPESGGNEHDTGGRPSRLEAKEARDDSASEGTGSWEGSERRRAEPTNVEPVRDARPPGESGEVKTDDPGAENGPGAEGGRDPNAEPATAGRPRAESIARAIERQKAEAEGANASGTDTPRPGDAGVGRGEAPGTGNRLDDGGEAGSPQAADDRTDAGQRDDGEPSEPEASEPGDAEAAHPARGDGLGRRASAEDPGATDGAEPSARDREPVTAEAAEPQQRTDEPGTDGSKTAESDNPAVTEPPDTGALAEPSREAADQPAERAQDVANDGEGGGPEGAAAPDLGRERDDAELADENEGPEPSPADVEEANEIPDGSGDDNDDHGRNAEEQPESPASEEDNPVIYRIRMPNGEEFGPPDTDRWVYHRGRLDPINEDQDLSEPDPEKGDSATRLFRALRENPDDVQKHLNGIGSDMAEAAPEQPPRGNPTSSQDTRVQPDVPQHHAPQVGDIMYAAAATAFVAFVVKQKISESIARRRGGEDDDN